MIVWLEAWNKSACPLLVHDFIFSISFYLFSYKKTPKYLMSLIAEGDGDDHYKWKKLVHHHRPLLPLLEPFDQNVFPQCSSTFFCPLFFISPGKVISRRRVVGFGWFERVSKVYKLKP